MNTEQKIHDLVQQWDSSFSIQNWVKIDGKSASPRSYYRVEGGKQKVVVCLDEKFDSIREKNLKNTVRYLKKANIPIPSLIFSSHELHGLIWEDVGNASLEQVIQEEQWDFDQFVHFTNEQIIPIIKKFWMAPIHKSFPYFGLAKYLFEWEFHVLLQTVPDDFFEQEPLFLQKLVEQHLQFMELLMETRTSSIHRDFQSSNLFFKNGSVYCIDFQDMHNGHPLYDLVSYIFDSYTPWKYDQRMSFLTEIIDAYQNIIDPLRMKPELKKEALYLVIQRKLHDVGSFLFSEKITGEKKFRKYIIPSLQFAAQAAEQLGVVEFRTIIEELFEVYHD